jgi:hypothetical protein
MSAHLRAPPFLPPSVVSRRMKEIARTVYLDGFPNLVPGPRLLNPDLALSVEAATGE